MFLQLGRLGWLLHSWQWEERFMVCLQCCRQFSLLTYHSSTAIRHLQRESRRKTPRIPVLYYYFNFRQEETQTCENFLRSIMRQLVQFLPDVPPELDELYEDYNSGGHRPSVKDLTSCFIAIIKTLDEVHLLGDALDECSQWNLLWQFSSKLVTAKCRSLHFLFTSRPEQHIRDSVNSLSIPELDLRKTSEMDCDIESFIGHSLEINSYLSQLPVQAKDFICQNLTERANRMYDLLSHLPSSCSLYLN
jgi:ankyrin repeat domain-containing protein 50